MLLQIQERHVEPDITVLELAGRLALGRESQRIETLVDELAKKAARKVIFDMTKVDYIDSAGIGLLALASGKMKESGGKLAIVAGPGRVLDLLKLTQITLVVTVCGTMAEAEAVLGGAAAGA
jgi:anti-sigma B factor antagonist